MKVILSVFSVICLLSFSVSTGNSICQKPVRDTIIVTDTAIITEDIYHKEVSHRKNGVSEGQTYELGDTGDTIFIFNYKNGKLNGPAYNFYSKNRICAISYYKDDYKVGKWVVYDSLGNLSSEKIFDKLYKNSDAKWSGKEKIYVRGKFAFTQIWLNGRRTDVIISDRKLYEEYKIKNALTGKKLFIANCASCHMLTREFEGPALEDINSKRNKKWLIRFIRNGDEVYKQGNNIAKTLYQKYSPIKHPDMTYLAASDVELILQFIKDQNNPVIK